MRAGIASCVFMLVTAAADTSEVAGMLQLHKVDCSKGDCKPTLVPKICCEAMNAQCRSCKDGITEEEFCRSNPKMAGCDAKDCSLVRCASENSCTDKGGSFRQIAGQCCGVCEIKPEVCVADNTDPCVLQTCSSDGEIMEAHVDCQRQMMGDASCNGHWATAGPDQCCDRCVETKECVAVNDPNEPCQRQECKNGELLTISMSCMSPDSCADIKEGAVYTPPGIGECCGSCVDPPVVDNSTDCKVDNSSPCRQEECLEDGTKATMIIDCAFDCQDGKYVPPTPGQCCGRCEKPECIVDTSDPCVFETCMPNGGKSIIMMACMPAEMCMGNYTSPASDQCCGHCEEKKCIENSTPCRHETCGQDGRKSIAVVDCMSAEMCNGALADPEPGQCCGVCQPFVCAAVMPACDCFPGEEEVISNDDNGCDFCGCSPKCKDLECDECPLGQKIVMKLDDTGCEYCTCEGPICSTDIDTCECLPEQELTVIEDKNGCDACACKGEPCAEPDCDACPLAQKLSFGEDSRGCATCVCEGRVCQEPEKVECLLGQTNARYVDKDGCPINVCHGRPCPEPTCAECPFAQKLVTTQDNRGCSTCACVGIVCPKIMPVCSCQPGQEHVTKNDPNGCESCGCEGEPCKEPVCECAKGEQHAFNEDARGCKTCECKAPPVKPCPRPEACDCKLGQQHKNKKDANGCYTCSCEGTPCAEPTCATCPFAQKLAYNKDNRGCSTCKCEGKVCRAPVCNCQRGQTRVNGKDRYGCDTCSCQGQPCGAAHIPTCPLVQQPIKTQDGRGCDLWSCQGKICRTPSCNCKKGQKLVRGTDRDRCSTCTCQGTPCRAPSRPSCPKAQVVKKGLDARTCDTLTCTGKICRAPNCHCQSYQRLVIGKDSSGCQTCSCIGTQPPPFTPVSGNCIMYGDPNIETFDGLFTTHAMSLYDAYDLGDFWIVKSSNVHIQGRYCSDNGAVKSLCAIAVGGSLLNYQTLVIEPLGWHGLTFDMQWRGQAIRDSATFRQAKQDGSFRASGVHSAPSNTFTFSNGLILKVDRGANSLNAEIKMKQQQGGQSGHCGNFNRNAVDDRAELQNNRNLVLANQVLFTKPAPRSGKRGGSTNVNQCNGAVKAKAAKFCADNIPCAIKSELEACVFDACFASAGTKEGDVKFLAKMHSENGCPKVPIVTAPPARRICTGVQSNWFGITTAGCQKCVDGTNKWWPCNDAKLVALCQCR